MFIIFKNVTVSNHGVIWNKKNDRIIPIVLEIEKLI
jgi:hypothetical protein